MTRPNDYAHRNLLLQASLGLLAWARHIDRWLDEYGRPRELGDDEVPDDQPDPAREEITLALLGLVRLRRELSAIVDDLPETPGPSSGGGEPASSGSLLR